MKRFEAQFVLQLALYPKGMNFEMQREVSKTIHPLSIKALLELASQIADAQKDAIIQERRIIIEGIKARNP